MSFKNIGVEANRTCKPIDVQKFPKVFKKIAKFSEQQYREFEIVIACPFVTGAGSSSIGETQTFVNASSPSNNVLDPSILDIVRTSNASVTTWRSTSVC